MGHEWEQQSTEFFGRLVKDSPNEWKCARCGYIWWSLEKPTSKMQVYLHDPRMEEQVPVDCDMVIVANVLLV